MMDKLRKLHRYSHGYLKDGGTFQFLEVFHLEINNDGKIIDGEISAMINSKYEVMTLHHFLEKIRPETIA